MSVTPAFIILPSDVNNTGKNTDNVQLLNENSATVFRQVVSVGDPQTAANRQTVNSVGGASVSVVPLPLSQLSSVVINTNLSGAIQLVAPVAGKTVRLYRLLLVAGGDTTITFEDGSVPLSGPIPISNYGDLVLDFSGDPWYQGASGDTLNIVNGSAVQLSGTAWYVQS